jgi:hypothetical protein
LLNNQNADEASIKKSKNKEKYKKQNTLYKIYYRNSLLELKYTFNAHAK